MAYNYYQQGSKYSTLPQIPQKDVEVTQDMHLKMSKKIAQLTKVIYALNTKNDENEAIVQKLQEDHEEELQKVLSETQQKLTLYQERLGQESDHAATISALQSRLAEYQLQVSEADSQLEGLKNQLKNVQEKDKAAYEAKLVDMSTEVLRAKTDFEEHMQRFDLWRERIVNEHNTQIASLQSTHQKEIEDLRGFHRNQDDTWLNQCAKIEDKYKEELEGLRSQIQTFQNERQTLKDEYTAKLDKASAFYENELEALRNSHLEQHEKELESLQKEMVKLRADCGSSEKELRSQIDGLVRKLADTEDALEESRAQQQVLQAELSGRDSSSSELSKQIQDLSDQLSKKTGHIQTVETALSGSKQHCDNLQEQLMQQSSCLGELEAHNHQKDGQILALQEELKALKQQLTQTDAERLALQSQHNSLSMEQNGQLKSLRQAIEDLTVERETLKQRMDHQVISFQAQLAQKDADLKESLAKQAKEAEQKLQQTRDLDRKMAAETLAAAKQELKLAHDAELSRAVFERDAVQQEMETIKAQLTSQLLAAQNEVTRLEQIVKDSEQGLGTASSQMTSMKDAMTRLSAELDKTRAELQIYKTKAATVEAELSKLQVTHEARVKEMETQHRTRLENLSKETDARWKETMRNECNKLRQEVTAQKDDEKKAALTHLSALKEQEIAAVRVGLDSQLQHLKAQMDELQNRLNNSHASREEDQAKWEARLEEEHLKLKEELIQAANEYAGQVQAMEKLHAQEMERLKAKMEQEKTNAESELKSRHMEELQGLLTANKAALDSANQLQQREREQALAELALQHQEEKVSLQEELQQQKDNELEALGQDHKAQLNAARMELQRAVEISKQKDKDHELAAEELRSEIGHREQHVRNLQEQVGQLQQEIERLKSAMKAKIAEVKQAHKEASINLKLQEEKLTKINEAALESLAADHHREQQDLLAQFNAAQEMLKDKISELQIELEEANERYAQRESRPEDLEAIESLRCEVQEREVRIKDLIDEKRFYQLELVNRETNFNKVFNTTPNVGVLNPFQKPKKKGEKLSGKLPSLAHNNGLSSSHQRLDPLPGSPLHDNKLNPTKPLPQPAFTKKFVN